MVMQKNNMHDTDTFEFFKYIIKMWIAVWLVSNAFTFSMAVFDVAQNLVNQAAGVINTSAVISGEEIVQMVEGLKDKGLGELVMIDHSAVMPYAFFLVHPDFLLPANLK